VISGSAPLPRIDGVGIEWLNEFAERGEHLRGDSQQAVLPARVGQSLEAVADLGDGDRRGEQLAGRLRADPVPDLRGGEGRINSDTTLVSMTITSRIALPGGRVARGGRLSSTPDSAPPASPAAPALGAGRGPAARWHPPAGGEGRSTAARTTLVAALIIPVSSTRPGTPSCSSTSTSRGWESICTTSPGAAAGSDPNVPSGRHGRAAESASMRPAAGPERVEGALIPGQSAEGLGLGASKGLRFRAGRYCRRSLDRYRRLP
jgi:hypothetical protein